MLNSDWGNNVVKKSNIQIISQQTLFAEKLSVPPSFIERMKKEISMGGLTGGIIGLITFLSCSITFTTTIFSLTVIAFAPVWIPAVVAMALSGVGVSAILAYLKKIGVFNGNKKIIVRSFESKLDELAMFVFTLVLQPAIGILSTCNFDESLKKSKIKELLTDWGYSPVWVDSNWKKIKPKNAFFVEKVSSVIWREYRSWVKNPQKKGKGNSYDSIIKDLPSPDFLREKMKKVALDLLSGEPYGKAQQKYIDKLEKF